MAQIIKGKDEWFITDDDCLQCCCRHPDIDPDSYEFVQIIGFDGHVDGKPFWVVAHANINVKDFTEKDIQSALNYFDYEDMDDFVYQNAPDWNVVYHEDGSIDKENSPSYIIDYQLIAEMLFETDALAHYCESEHSSWNDAVKCISQITGMDLSAYLETKKGLDEQIQSAQSRETQNISVAPQDRGR